MPDAAPVRVPADPEPQPATIADRLHATEEALHVAEAMIPSEDDQAVIDYFRGANLTLEDYVESVRMVGALGGMLDRQAKTIAQQAEVIRGYEARDREGKRRRLTKGAS